MRPGGRGEERLRQLVVLHSPPEMPLRIAERFVLVDRLGVIRHRLHLEVTKIGGIYARQRRGFVDVAQQVVHPLGVVVDVVPAAPAARDEEIDAVENAHAAGKRRQRVVAEIEIALVVPRIERF